MGKGDRFAWRKARPPTAHEAEAQIDALLDQYLDRARERGWAPTSQADVEDTIDGVVRHFLGHFDDSAPADAPQEELDPLWQGIYAALASQSPSACGNLRALFRELALAALFPADVLSDEQIARWAQLPQRMERHQWQRRTVE